MSLSKPTKVAFSFSPIAQAIDAKYPTSDNNIENDKCTRVINLDNNITFTERPSLKTVFPNLYAPAGTQPQCRQIKYTVIGRDGKQWPESLRVQSELESTKVRLNVWLDRDALQQTLAGCSRAKTKYVGSQTHTEEIQLLTMYVDKDGYSTSEFMTFSELLPSEVQLTTGIPARDIFELRLFFAFSVCGIDEVVELDQSRAVCRQEDGTILEMPFSVLNPMMDKQHGSYYHATFGFQYRNNEMDEVYPLVRKNTQKKIAPEKMKTVKDCEDHETISQCLQRYQAAIRKHEKENSFTGSKYCRREFRIWNFFKSKIETEYRNLLNLPTMAGGGGGESIDQMIFLHKSVYHQWRIDPAMVTLNKSSAKKRQVRTKKHTQSPETTSCGSCFSSGRKNKRRSGCSVQ